MSHGYAHTPDDITLIFVTSCTQNITCVCTRNITCACTQTTRLQLTSNGSHRSPESPRDHANSCFQNEAPTSRPGPQVIVKPSVECSIIIQHTITTMQYHSTRLRTWAPAWLFFLRLLEANQTILFRMKPLLLNVPALPQRCHSCSESMWAI